jgi:hypothetical protein
MDREKAKEYYEKSNSYRIIAVAFAILGVFLFVSMLSKAESGGLLKTFSNPSTLIILIFPFLPAVFLSLQSAKFSKKYLNEIKKTEDK